MSRKDTFCIMPFVHLHNMGSGLLKMCCLVEKPITDDFGDTFFIGNQPIEEVWNSNFLKSARRLMLDNNEVKMCNQCYSIEDSGGRSLRNEYNTNYKERFIPLVEEAKQNDCEIKTFPPFVELRTGNTCNSACRMCNTNDSSLVYKENTEIHNTLKFKGFDSKTVERGYRTMGQPERIIFGLRDDTLKDRVMDLDQHFDEIIANIKNIKIITLSGGEPFLLEKTAVLLEELATKNPNVMLYVNTNGSIITDRLVNALNKIEEVRLCISLDGHGLTQEYIRYPLKWDKIERNMYEIKSLTRKGFYLNFNITVQAFNILNLDPLLTMLVKDFAGHHVNLSFLSSPPHFAVQQLPQIVKDRAVLLNQQLADKLRNIETIPGYRTENKLRLADRLLELNAFMLAEKNPDPELFEQLKANVKIYDYYRKQNTAEYLPDWVPFL